ncbi:MULTISPECIES: hypothetical protein [Xanthomonas]|uniref:hypothetical protein n=2 Tax=Xanthomonas TaxID=338 RepID=UPI00035C9A80|nr:MULTISPECIES: hypothetical protein [Xanthomonas]KAB7766109.1 hypothetical protein CEK68_10585 [Xanthomonas sp. LMG 12461]KAB7776104.1 hypothetical protein CEK66_15315 [Xanthomonas sp. LMG 12460]MCW0391154.1 hypothetical protein [Xanthomonas sacchari]MCW0463527.1 hypothetical protein [Xanthomonas sacchari]MDY4284153.1 hypothetical protein [Xanthomonas sp. LF06-19]
MKSFWLPRICMTLALAVAVQGSSQAKQASSHAGGEQAIAYVLKNDIVLSRLFADCPALKFVRTGAEGSNAFLIEGNCDIKNNPEEDADCPSYHVHATGTMDTPSHWTVRRLELALVCSSEGATTTQQM